MRQGCCCCCWSGAAITTLGADFPVEAAEKWDWVWKALVFAIFLPLTLRTRLRIEAAALVMVLSAGGDHHRRRRSRPSLGGGGYGALQLLVDDNTGLYEGSIMSMRRDRDHPADPLAGAARHDLPARLAGEAFAAALIFACLLIPIGTQARTGLLCIGAARRADAAHGQAAGFSMSALVGALGLIAMPFLPAELSPSG